MGTLQRGLKTHQTIQFCKPRAWMIATPTNDPWRVLESIGEQALMRPYGFITAIGLEVQPQTAPLAHGAVAGIIPFRVCAHAPRPVARLRLTTARRS